MATETISQLPRVASLVGNELFIISVPSAPPVPFTSGACTVQQISNFFVPGLSGGVTMRQLRAALASQGVFFTVDNQVPADPSNSSNIAWNHATMMTQADPFITGFLQGALSYSSGQIATLFALALTFPS